MDDLNRRIKEKLKDYEKLEALRPELVDKQKKLDKDLK